MAIAFEDITVSGSISLRGSVGSRISALSRTELLQSDNFVFPVAMTDWRVHDAIQTNLPGTSASDDLGLYGGTFGTSQPLIRTYDVKAAGAQSLYARALIRLPESYKAGETVTLRLSAGMITTVADTSCTINVNAYRIGKDNTIGSQLCPTGAVTMNSLTFTNKDFTITASTLGPGDVLDTRIVIAVNDAASAGVVIAAIAGVDLLCDIQG